MILTRTPLRVSFVGGGSDLPAFYTKERGAVLSSTIDKYVYLCVNRRFDQKIRIGYNKTEIVSEVDHIQHPLVREALKMFHITGGIEIVSLADIPADGTGLGSSSSFTVGLLNALNKYSGKDATPEELAHIACEIEIKKCNGILGKQDQYTAAYGGFNLIEFHSDESVKVKPLQIDQKFKEYLNEHCMFFYTGIGRKASLILEKVSESLKNQDSIIKQREMVCLVDEMYCAIANESVEKIASLLDKNWQLKKTISSSVSGHAFDEIYDLACSNGALGGKLLGAGGGGFFVFIVPPSRQQTVRNALNQLEEIDINFIDNGSQVINANN